MADYNFDAELDAILAEFSDKKNETPAESFAEPEHEAPKEIKRPHFEESSFEDIGEEIEEIKEKTVRFKERPAEEKATRKPEADKRAPKAKKQEPEYTATAKRKNPIHIFLAVICALIALFLLLWIAKNVHPGATAGETTSAKTGSANITGKINSYSNSSKAGIIMNIEGAPPVRIEYKLDYEPALPPKAGQQNFHRTTIDNLQPVLDTIEKAKASGLIAEDEKMIFSTDVEFYHDPEIEADIQYYYDDTILVICWKELIENRVCSCVEVKIADGSQIRRKLCEDTYDSSVYLFATDLARQTNAVAAMNADYYAFRNLGITVYDRTVYRFNEFTYSGFYQAYNSTDTLFINDNGDFIFFRRGQQTTKEEIQQYVTDNNIRFAIAFGPVLVENGELQYCESYPVGEINSEYSRAGIAQCGERHYLYMAVSHAWDGAHPRCTVNEFGGYMHSKGVENAYCLDGGQTGEVVFNGVPFNHIDFGNERTVSDIIYFATALPEEESR